MTAGPQAAPDDARSPHAGRLNGDGDLAAWRAARRILAVRLDNLGDVLMTTPALRALRNGRPGCRITLLAGPAGMTLEPYLPEVDDAMQASTPWLPGAVADPDELLGLAGRLRARRFDAAVIFTVYSQSALPAAMLCWLAGIPLRLAHARENPYHLLTDWIADPEPHEVLRHEVRRQLDLVGAIGATTAKPQLSFTPGAPDRERAARHLAAAGINPARPYIVVHPGASAPSRRYPGEHYAAALERLPVPADGNIPQIVFTGDASEAAVIETVRGLTRRPTATLAGTLDLGTLAAVIDGAALLIANNTGPVHLAAALGTPVVDLYAMTNPQHAPWKVPHRVLYEDVPCRWCYRSVCPRQHHDCLNLLDPARVAEAARELLDGGAEWSAPPLRARAPGADPGAKP